MIELKEVSKSFHSTKALSKINLSIEQGERIALIGPSGSGKTTLLKLLNAQHIATEGSLKVNDIEVAKLSPKQLRIFRSDIAYIPQDLGLVPSLKVYQNVLLGKIGRFRTLSMLRKILLPRKAELAAVHEVLERVGIPEKLYDTTSTLSGGQQQRVALARALFQQPHTILADEPARGRARAGAVFAGTEPRLVSSHGFALDVKRDGVQIATGAPERRREPHHQCSSSLVVARATRGIPEHTIKSVAVTKDRCRT